MQHYDYYIAVDWSQLQIAVAIGRADMGSDRVFELKTDIGKLIEILKGLKGSKVLTFEESTSSHWLYLSLKRYVDELIVCDPYLILCSRRVRRTTGLMP